MGSNKGLAVAWTFAMLVLGCSGADGSAGKDGKNGTDGKDGANGDAGPAGAIGSPGQPGADGAIGATGPTKARLLDDKIGGWESQNRDALNQLLKDHGIASPSFDPEKRPVAVFDWDNTVMKNDIGDATFAWMVQHDKIRQPAGKDWSTTNANLNAAAKAALNAACDAAASEGDPLPTSTTPACAAEIMNVYYNATTAAGADAWDNEKTTTTNNPYAWAAELQAGYEPSEIRSFAQQAFDENNWAPIGTKQTVGGVEMAGYVRVYPQIRDLTETLRDNGFDVWIVTASPQYNVEAVSEEVGVPPNHVIGIRSVVVGGRLTSDIQGCGDVADGDNSLITFYAGKRCWINKVIYGLAAGDQLAKNADPSMRPAFVAGDSDTDIVMLKDATVLKLVIVRNKLEIMCNALANYQSKWLRQPMFIEPKSKPTSPYPCSTAVEPAPSGAVISDEAGQPIPDQTP